MNKKLKSDIKNYISFSSKPLQSKDILEKFPDSNKEEALEALISLLESKQVKYNHAKFLIPIFGVDAEDVEMSE